MKVRTYYAKHGIERQSSTPYQHWQNSVERDRHPDDDTQQLSRHPRISTHACRLLDTENGSRNNPNTMCGLVGTFLISAEMFLIPCVLWAISGTISNMFLIPNNIRNNLSVPDIMRNYFTMFLIWRCLFSLYDNLLVI